VGDITTEDLNRRTEAARTLPEAIGVYHDDTNLVALVSTVVDFQLRTTAVVKASRTRSG